MSDDPAPDVVMATAKSIHEGKAEILLPPNVFYNPVQEFNRDLTIAVISQVSLELWTAKRNNGIASTGVITATLDATANNPPMETQVATTTTVPLENITDDMKVISEEGDAFPQPGNRHADGIRIVEGLAASGLRSVRFALEVPWVREVVANDFDRVAYEYIKRNVSGNGVDDIVTASYADASLLMYNSRKHINQFDVVDLDPYGSPAIFLDAAVQCVRDGGLLCVTCTDMAVLCGNATETCHAKYGSTSLKGRFCHEMAVRILLRSIESHANRYSRYIVPLVSLSVDFYCRVFVRVYTSQKTVKDSATKLSMVYQCNGCGSYALQPLVAKTMMSNESLRYSVSVGPPVGERCAHCDGRFNLGGPIWSAPVHDRGFVERVIAGLGKEDGRFGTVERIRGVLSVVCEELDDVPLYYEVDHLCAVIHCTAIGFLPMRSALLHRGFKVSLSHTSKKSLKTNAPSEVIWDILRCWVRKNPVSVGRLQKGSVAERILSRDPSFDADFSTHPDANPASREKGLVRWQLNPVKDWGPKPRAARSAEAVEEKKQAQIAKCRERKEKRKAENEARQEDFQPTTLNSKPCKRFRRGKCHLGSACHYSHAGRTENLEKSGINPTETSPCDDHDEVSAEMEKTLNDD